MAEVLIWDTAEHCRAGAGLAEGLDAIRGGAPLVWMDVPSKAEDELKQIASVTGLHELTIEDMINTEVRPKTEEFERYLFVVFKALRLDADRGEVTAPDFNAALGANFLVTTHETELEAARHVRERVAKHPASAARGPAFLLYMVLDSIVDAYFPVMDQLEDVIDRIENRLFDGFEQGVAQEIYRWKAVVSRLRRHVSPQRDTMVALANRPQDLVPAETQVYLRDVYDHLIRVNDHLDAFRDILQGAMESYMTQVSNRMNQVMKTLSVVATIMLPLGILTGLYGTNFAHLPGQETPGAFWIFVGGMVALMAGGALVFKLLRWY